MVDPGWPLHDLWPQQCTTLWSGVLLTNFGSHRVLLRQIDPWMTFDPRLSRFENMPTNLVGTFPTPMPTFSSIPDPGWSVPDLWPQQCIMLWSGILDTKIGGHRALLSKLTPSWPQLTATWPSTPAMHYDLVRGRTSLVPTDISQQREALHRGWGAARSAAPQPREQENLQKILLPLQTTPSKCLIGPHTVPICHHLSLCQLYQNI